MAGPPPRGCLRARPLSVCPLLLRQAFLISDSCPQPLPCHHLLLHQLRDNRRGLAVLVTGKHSCSVQGEGAQRWHQSGCVSSTVAGGHTDIGGHSVTIVASDGVMCISTLTTSSDGGSNFIELLLFS